MNVLVTGCAGFIGSHLVDAYLQRGDTVIGLDNFCTSGERNLESAQRQANFTLVPHDVSGDYSTLLTSVRALATHLDAVLHFASPASPVDYANLPIETLHVNGYGTESCCRLANDLGATLLYASTSEVYGDPRIHPQVETYNGNVNPVGPRSCYDEGKRFGEAMIAAYGRARHLRYSIIRIFNTYGPRMRSDDGRVVPNFIKQALQRAPLTIYGDGSQTRSLCYVDDLVRGIMACAEEQSSRGMVLNLGNPHEITMLELAGEICSLTGAKLMIERRELPVDDPQRRCPNIERASSLLGWRPRVDLKEGLQRTIAFFKEDQTAAALAESTSSKGFQ
ncbi:MAG: GDP-mannose 4,6-dehydratase [Candidatus Eremiobacteraeota bacterium]|nr:GDP-mannose 4,6-dehydratase [Candidatus Eremiobacteraeota bacterium]